jgi:hypothetical protein
MRVRGGGGGLCAAAFSRWKPWWERLGHVVSGHSLQTKRAGACVCVILLCERGVWAKKFLVGVLEVCVSGVWGGGLVFLNQLVKHKCVTNQILEDFAARQNVASALPLVTTPQAQ